VAVEVAGDARKRLVDVLVSMPDRQKTCRDGLEHTSLDKVTRGQEVDFGFVVSRGVVHLDVQIRGKCLPRFSLSNLVDDVHEHTPGSIDVVGNVRGTNIEELFPPVDLDTNDAGLHYRRIRAISSATCTGDVSLLLVHAIDDQTHVESWFLPGILPGIIVAFPFGLDVDVV